MSSILTNTSAMVALQTLNMTNKNLSEVQGQISTGKRVADARQNASIWAISQTMQSDVQGFKGITDALATGSAAVAVARTAAETVTDLLVQVKEKVIAAQSDTADKAKLQTDINELVNQIGSVVSAAQFNGLNLVNGSKTSINVLASLDRDGSGNVSASNIAVTAQDLTTTAGTAPTGVLGALSTGVSANGTIASTFVNGTGGTADIVFDSTNLAAGDKFVVNIAGEQASYTVTAEDLATTTPANTIAAGVRSAIQALGLGTSVVVDYNAATVSITNNGTSDIALTTEVIDAGAGGLAGLSAMDVSTALGAANALTNVESYIQTAIDAAAAFGSSQGRIDIQQDFVSSLTDSLKTGIGALVDANMEEASARLQALQVQQQLGIQALSIANQSPQNVLSLFR